MGGVLRTAVFFLFHDCNRLRSIAIGCSRWRYAFALDRAASVVSAGFGGCLAAVLALAPALAYAAPAAVPRQAEERQDGKTEEAAGTDPLRTALLQAVDVLEREGLANPRDEMARNQLLQGLLSGIGCGARYETAAAADGREDTRPDPWNTGTLVRLDRQYAYVPVNHPGPGVAEALTKAWAAAAGEPDGAPVALILDLRFASGGDLPAAKALAQAVTQIDALRVLLIGPDTVGAAEIAAVLIVAAPQGAVLVGRPSRGCFASLEPVRLPNGDRLWLPRPVKNVDGHAMPAHPLTPEVSCDDASTSETAAGLTNDRFRAFPDRDRPLRRAVDLLKTIQALKAKHF